MLSFQKSMLNYRYSNTIIQIFFSNNCVDLLLIFTLYGFKKNSDNIVIFLKTKFQNINL